MRPSAPFAFSKATKVVAALLRGQLSAMGGRFTINCVRSTPMGKSRPRMRFLRPRREASFAWLANLVTIGSRSLFQLPYCFNHRRSWSSHPPPDPSCSNRRRTLLDDSRRWSAVSFRLPNHRPQLLDSPVALDSFQNELLAAAKDLFTRCQHSASRHFVRWHCQTKSTVELAMSHPDQSLSISDLARQDGVPERTLRTAFQRCYGLSPVEYLRIHRLHQARRLLRGSCQDETTVTQIAFGLGFWDLGRFAGAYRQLFGERPSETLRKPVRVSVGMRPN